MASMARNKGENQFPTPTVTSLTHDQRIEEAAQLLDELFVENRTRLLRWSDKTGQTAQVDSGYIAQHLVSVVTGTPGVRRRGKGLDLVDNSEVKTANSVDGVDVPRWNLSFVREGTMGAMLEHPFVYFVLFDEDISGRVRSRIWGIAPSTDVAFQQAFKTWREGARLSTNFQLHPPVGRDDDVATNLSGNLQLPKIFEALVEPSGLVRVTLLRESPISASVFLGSGRWDRKLP
jgi:hypothetical protein